MEPSLTVLTPAYLLPDQSAPLREQYLGQAVESILDQTFTDFEFLIVNDGSPEEALDLLGAYRDSRIRVIHLPHIGQAAARNEGLRQSRGKYVAMMDVDDLSHRERLEKQVEVMESMPQVDIVGAYFDVIDDRGEIIEVVRCPLDPAHRLWRLQFRGVYGHGSLMFRRESILAAGCYDASLPCAMDYELAIRMCGLHNTHVVPESLYQYRKSSAPIQVSALKFQQQCAIAHNFSEKRLLAFHENLSSQILKDIRLVYWRELPGDLPKAVIQVIPTLVSGFCDYFEVGLDQRADLMKAVFGDIQEAACWRAKDKLSLIGAIHALLDTFPQDSRRWLAKEARVRLWMALHGQKPW